MQNVGDLARRVMGATLLAGAALGLLLVVAGLVMIGGGLSAAEAAADDQLAQLDQALLATGDGLDVAGRTLGEARVAIGSIDDALTGSTRAISDTLPILNTVADLAAKDLPETISTTQTALGSARETARVVDRTLGGISSLGLLSAAVYNPQVPLSDAIGDVSESLGTLPEPLAEMESGLRGATDNLGEVNDDLVAVAAGVAEIERNMGEAAGVIGQYQELVTELRSDVGALRAALPGWFTAARVALLLILIWMALAQLSLVLQGWALTANKDRITE